MRRIRTNERNSRFWAAILVPATGERLAEGLKFEQAPDGETPEIYGFLILERGLHFLWLAIEHCGRAYAVAAPTRRGVLQDADEVLAG